MSWGTAAEGASSAGSGAASGIGSAASGVGTGAAGSSIYGQMADSAANSGASAVQPVSGFSLDAVNSTGEAANLASGASKDVANMETYGTTTPSLVDKATNTIERFQKGGKQSFNDMSFDNSPEMYGYLYDKANAISGMAGAAGKGGGAAPITTNISYQQPENPYLKKRGRY